jgi:hypothetical protein
MRPFILSAIIAGLVLPGCSHSDPQPPTSEEMRGAVSTQYKRMHPDSRGVEIRVIRVGEAGKGDFAAPGSQDSYWPVEFKVRGKDVDIGPVQISSDKFHGIAKVWKDKLVGWKVGEIEQLSLDADLTNPEKGVDGRWQALFELYARRSDLITAYLERLSPTQAGLDSNSIVATKAALADIRQVSLDSQAAPNDETQLDAFEQAQRHLSASLIPLVAWMGRESQIRSDAAAQEFQRKLEGVENSISVQRIQYNAAVKEYNMSVSSAEKEKPLLKP